MAEMCAQCRENIARSYTSTPKCVHALCDALQKYDLFGYNNHQHTRLKCAHIKYILDMKCFPFCLSLARCFFLLLMYLENSDGNFLMLLLLMLLILLMLLLLLCSQSLDSIYNVVKLNDMSFS